MFHSLFGTKKQTKRGNIFSPVSGTAVSLQEVNDPTFREEILGKGAAVVPSEGDICAPCDGTIALLFDTGHAFTMTSVDGAEILVHVGIDTVKLEGKHFKLHKQNGDKVYKGELILTADIASIKQKGYDPITAVVVCNTPEYASVEALAFGDIKIGGELLYLKNK